MKAYKCDRCKRLYEPYKLTDEYSWRGACLIVGHPGCCFDLCPVCAKALVDFMAAYKDVENCSDGKD